MPYEQGRFAPMEVNGGKAEKKMERRIERLRNREKCGQDNRRECF